MQKFPRHQTSNHICVAETFPVIIPYRQLSQDALLGLVEEFVTRDGTDYGEEEIPLPRRVAQVMKQLERGDVVILFDSDSNSCNIVSKSDLPRSGQDTGNDDSGQTD